MSTSIQSLLESMWRAIPESARECFEASHLTQMVQVVASHIPGMDTEVEGGTTIPGVVKAFLGRLRQVERLRNLTYAPQRSEAWLNQRKNLLTASDLASALNKGKFSSRSALLKKKIEARMPIATASGTDSSVSGGYKCAAMSWGTMFEPMIARIYSEMNGDIELYEFGLVPHPTLTCFGASPDGITELGKMVEIKCPWRREIKLGEVPEQYMLQIQGQLSVCGLDECDYIEVVMEDLENKETYVRTVGEDATHAHGVILELQTADEQQSGSQHYEYSPARLTPSEAFSWATTYIQTRLKSEPSLNIARIRPWKMKTYNLVTVAFDAPMWETLVPQIEQFWKEVEDGTVAAATAIPGTAPVPRQRRAKKNYAYRDDDTPSIS